MTYSTQRVSSQLLEEIKTALQNIHYGSVEIFIQDRQVTQITVRNIKKTKLEIDNKSRQNVSRRRKGDSALSHKIEVLTLNK